MPRWFNGGPEPLVPDGRWGEGVVMPGEWYETDAEMTSPWTLDPEADAAVEAARNALRDAENAAEGNASGDAPDGVSGAQDGSQPPPDEGPSLRTLENGDVVNEAGEVVGHIDNGGNA